MVDRDFFSTFINRFPSLVLRYTAFGLKYFEVCVRQFSKSWYSHREIALKRRVTYAIISRRHMCKNTLKTALIA